MSTTKNLQLQKAQ